MQLHKEATFFQKYIFNKYGRYDVHTHYLI